MGKTCCRRALSQTHSPPGCRAHLSPFMCPGPLPGLSRNEMSDSEHLRHPACFSVFHVGRKHHYESSTMGQFEESEGGSKRSFPRNLLSEKHLARRRSVPGSRLCGPSLRLLKTQRGSRVPGIAPRSTSQAPPLRLKHPCAPRKLSPCAPIPFNPNQTHVLFWTCLTDHETPESSVAWRAPRRTRSPALPQTTP